MKYTITMKKIFLLFSILLTGYSHSIAQEAITLDKALSIAESASPEIQQSLLNLMRFQKTLEAQRAALKSQFSLDLNPVAYRNGIEFVSNSVIREENCLSPGSN